MKDDEKPQFFCSTPMSAGKNTFYKMFEEAGKISKNAWVGIDWAKDSGMNRGEVIERKVNVTHVRFKTVSA